MSPVVRRDLPLELGAGVCSEEADEGVEELAEVDEVDEVDAGVAVAPGGSSAAESNAWSGLLFTVLLPRMFGLQVCE
jgi:hypothetical protein